MINLFFIFVNKNSSTDYAKIRQITVDAIIPATSAANAASKIHLVFFIPTQLVSWSSLVFCCRST